VVLRHPVAGAHEHAAVREQLEHSRELQTEDLDDRSGGPLIDGVEVVEERQPSELGQCRPGALCI
jgi:hypothetical protein